MNNAHQLKLKNGQPLGVQPHPEARAMLHAFVDLLCDHMECTGDVIDVVNTLGVLADNKAEDNAPGFEAAYTAFIQQWFQSSQGGR